MVGKLWRYLRRRRGAYVIALSERVNLADEADYMRSFSSSY